MRILLPIAMAVFAGSLSACLWDRDLATLAADPPSVEALVAGRVDRFPIAYFEKRLERAEKTLKDDPDSLGAYENAVSALVRLGRDEEAQALSERHRLAIQRLQEREAEVGRAWYRYHGILATLWLQRLLATPKDWPEAAAEARKHLTRALEWNSSPPLSAELFELRLLDWLESEPACTDDAFPNLFHIDTAAPPPTGRAAVRDLGLSDAAGGLAALLLASAPALEDAPDLWNALSVAAYVHGERGLSWMAAQRAREAALAGTTSRVVGAPAGEELAAALWSPPFVEADLEAAKVEYARLRSDAADWRKRREERLVERMAQGFHPDVDERFWQEDPEPAALSEGDPESTALSQAMLLSTLAVGVALALAVGGAAVFLIRRHRAAPTVDDL